MGRSAVLSAFVVLALAAAACQTTKFREDSRIGGVRGPANSAGAIIYLHGKSMASEAMESGTPRYLRGFRNAGWDVIRMDRPRVVDKIRSNASALISKVRELKAQGYKKVVLTGQSFGGWSILEAATMSDEMDAVIATAPGAHGTAKTSPVNFKKKPKDFRRLMERIQKTAKVMIFFFKDDAYDTGTLGPVAKSILSRKGVVHEIIDQPTGFEGHGAVWNPSFNGRFTPRMLHFIEHGPMEIVRRPVRVDWQGYRSISGEVVFDPIRTHTFEIFTLGGDALCSGFVGLNESEKGKWSLACPDNRVAYGEFSNPDDPSPTSKGKDLEGRVVSLFFGEAISEARQMLAAR